MMLYPKFAKIVALMNSTEHGGERESARSRAVAMADAAGMTFDQAVTEIKGPKTQPASTNP